MSNTIFRGDLLQHSLHSHLACHGAAQPTAGGQIRLIVPFPAEGRPISRQDRWPNCWAMRSKQRSSLTTAVVRAARWAPMRRQVCARRAHAVMGTVGTHAINPALYKKLSYDAERDFHADCRLCGEGTRGDRGASLAFR